MKKAALTLFSLFLLCTLFSCAPVRRKVSYAQGIEQIQSIELYHSEQAYSEGNISGFRQENEPITVLQGDACAEFAQAFGNLKFEEVMMLIPIPLDGGCDYEGYVVAVVYADGGYDIFAERGSYSYVVGRDGTVRRQAYDAADYCGEAPWAELIEKYIEK